ncbi:MAG: anti-sigma factor family protein [Bryobacteraceae bacterium]
MNRVSFGEICERTRKYLDSYISNELTIETNHEVLRHLESCAGCAAEADARVQLRARLKAVVRNQPAPVELPVLIRRRIGAAESRKPFGAIWARWSLAAAASLALFAAVWVSGRPEPMPELANRPAQNTYIEKVSARFAAVLRVGLRDHIHCAVFRKYSKNPPSVEKMERELGPSYQGLLPVVRTAVPEGYRIVLAHQCAFAKRQYVHLTLANGDKLLSLVIARKQDGETFDQLSPAAGPSGIPIYQSGADRYQVAAFDAGSFLAYVISDMKGMANLQVASTLAPGVREFLTKTGV